MLPNVPQINSNYPVRSASRAQQLADAYGTNAIIGRGANAPTQQDLDALHARQGNALKTVLDDNMDAVLANLVTHQHNIDQLAQAAKGVINSAKAAVAHAEATGSTNDLATAVQATSHAAGLLNQMATLAHDDHQAFDGHWNQFRAFNAGDHVPLEYKQDFITAREKVMADGKLINAKVQKLEQLVTQAAAFNKMSSSLLNQGNKSTGEADQTAKHLEDQLLDLVGKNMGSENRHLPGGKNIGWYSVGSKIKMIRTTAALPHVPRATYKTLQQYQVNMVAALKSYKTTIKTMETLVATTLKSIPVDRQKKKEVAVRLANARAILAEATHVRDEAIQVVAEADRLMTAMSHKLV